MNDEPLMVKDAVDLRRACDLKAAQYKRQLYVEAGLDTYWPDLELRNLQRYIDGYNEWVACRTDSWGRLHQDPVQR